MSRSAAYTRGRRWWPLLCLTLGAPVALTACGGDDEGSGVEPPPLIGEGPARPSKKKAKKKRVTRRRGKDPLAGLTIPSPYVPVQWDRGNDLDLPETRDPFRIYLEELQPKEDTAGELPEGIVLEGALSRYEFNRYELKAIITATALPKAMITDPEGEGHIVRVGDIIGKDRPFRLIRIRRNELIFKSLQPDAEGNEVITSRSLWTEEEAGELFR